MVERLAQDFPDRPEHRRQLGRTLTNIGNVLSDQNRVQASEPFLRRAIEVYTPIAAKHVDDVQIRFDLAKAHLNMGELMRNSGEVKQAVDSFLGRLQRQLARRPDQRTTLDDPTAIALNAQGRRADRRLGNL